MEKIYILLLLLVFNFHVIVVADEGKPTRSSWSNTYIITIYIGFFLLSALTAFLVRRYRNGRFGVAVEADGESLPVAGGLESEDIESLPSLSYSELRSHNFSNDQGQGHGQVLECAVCLNEYKDQEILRLLPECLHVFHPDCIAPWLNSHVTCPICRASVEYRQGSSVSISSLLERSTSTSAIDTINHHHHHHQDHDHRGENDHRSDDNHVATLQEQESLSLQLGGVRRQGRLIRCYSTGDLSRLNKVVIKTDKWTCASSKSDILVDYRSLIVVHNKN